MSSYAESMRARGFFPIAYRLESMSPKDVAKLIRHMERLGEYFEHVDPTRTHLNRVVLGGSQVADEIVSEAGSMSDFNHRSNMLGLKQASRKKDLARVRSAGPKDPWLPQKKSKGPLREVVITVHRDFFRADDETPDDQRLRFLDDEGKWCAFDMRKVDRFQSAASEFLVEEFGESLRHLHFDLDEQSFHGHGIIARRVEEPASVRFAHGRQLYQPTGHRSLEDYEVAQNVIGQFFSREEHVDMKIVRGEPRAAMAREAKEIVRQLKEGEDLDAFLGEGEELPQGSPNAVAMFLLKKKMREEVAAKGGDAGRVRQDPAAALAIDYLELMGAITPAQKHEASTRRARKALLAQHEAAFGSPAQILSDPDAAEARFVAKLAAEKDAADRARAEADARAAEERDRLDREAAERRRTEDAERAERIRIEDERRAQEAADRQAEVEARASEVEKREAAVETKERELTLRERAVSMAAAAMERLADRIRKAARVLGLQGDETVRDGLEAGRTIRAMRQGDEQR